MVAVEASEMAEHASRLVERNQLAGVVQVLRGRVEEVALEGKVDLIVSEWMGTLLLVGGWLGGAWDYCGVYSGTSE